MTGRWLAIAAVSLSSVAVLAQTAFTASPPGSRGVVIGKPYTAQKIVRERRYLPDGTLVTREWDVTEARNAQGVTASCSKLSMPAGGDRSVLLEVHTVFDPIHHTSLHWSSLNHVAQMIHLPAAPVIAGTMAKLNVPKPQVEQLGQKTIDGILCTGTRRIITVPGEAIGPLVEMIRPGTTIGMTADLKSTIETWRDEQLGLIVAMTQTSAGTGTLTTELTGLQQGPPDPALFELPPGYTLNDIHAGGSSVDPNEVLAAAGPDAAHLPAMSYADALVKLGDPMNRAVAAAVLVKMAAEDNDPTEKDKIAYAVARVNLQLVAAESLEQSVVAVGEHQLASMPQTLPLSRNTALAEHELARYWDTLGYILEREGSSGLRYLQAAWELDPHAYYGQHLGRAYESTGNVQEALAVYRAAIETDGSSHMKQRIEDRIQALSGMGTPMTASASASQSYAVAAIRYTPGAAEPQIHFLSAGRVSTPERAAAQAAAKQWTAPDNGPEVVTRLIAISCAGREPCTAHTLPVLSPGTDR